jgi:hypothetical protein
MSDSSEEIDFGDAHLAAMDAALRAAGLQRIVVNGHTIGYGFAAAGGFDRVRHPRRRPSFHGSTGRRGGRGRFRQLHRQGGGRQNARASRAAMLVKWRTTHFFHQLRCCGKRQGEVEADEAATRER